MPQGDYTTLQESPHLFIYMVEVKTIDCPATNNLKL